MGRRAFIKKKKRNLNIGNVEKCTERPQLNSNDLIREVPYIWTSWDCESHTCMRFALQSAVFKILHILRFSHSLKYLEFQSATQFSKLGRLSRKVIACIPPWNGSQWPHKVWLTSDQNYRSSTLKKCHQIFHFWWIFINVIA